MELTFLGGAQEVGRSAIVVNDSLLLEYGMLAGTPPKFPVADSDPDAVVVSHGHLDHAGAIPALLSGDSRPSIHWTPPTRELAVTLAEDTLKLHGNTLQCPFTETDVRRIRGVSEAHSYQESFTAAGHEVTFYNAGHIPGSAHVLIDDGDTRLLYTGDFHTDDQRLVSGTTARRDADAHGAPSPAPMPQDVDVVLCESTYSDIDHEPRATVEDRFVRSVEETLWEGGTVVVPAFAIGRTQELLLVCDAHDIPCYVDGMGKRVTKMLLRYPEFLRDADALRRAKSHARFVTGEDGQRKRIAEQKAAIITTSGMLSGGPAMTYIPEIRSNPTNKITLTGYQVEGTPGRRLLETGSAEIDGRTMRVAARVEQYDFSAHADRDGLRSVLDSYADSEVIVNHGDRCVSFAEELATDGITAVAPAVGETITVG
jgi:putative mRNA 3-end processing factor